jgi:hypothetical protein
MTEEHLCESILERKPSRILACDFCGKQIEHHTGRRPRFCSARCRNRENGHGRVRKALLGRDIRALAKLEKKNNKFKALQRAKMLSSHRIFGPADILAIELFARSWSPTISSGGVTIETSRLRARALVERQP